VLENFPKSKDKSYFQVWAAGSKEGIHDPPSHYIWKQLDKWGTGPECTTILCKANGQAIAWMTSAPVSNINSYKHL